MKKYTILMAALLLISCAVHKPNRGSYEAWRACIAATDGTDIQCAVCDTRYGKFKLKNHE